MKKPVILLLLSEQENEDYFLSLLNESYECVVVHSKRSAAELLLDNTYLFDLVITDMTILKEDWLHLQHLSYQQRGVGSMPLISILNSETEEQIDNTLVHENSDVIRKPLIDKIVLHRINNMLKTKRNASYVNIMEEIVTDEIDRIIDSLDICKCPLCRADLMLITLNNLPAKYVSSEKGILLSKTNYMSKENMIPVMTEIAKAAQMVKEKPNH